MLRNSFKISYIGLAFCIFLSACSSTKPLLYQENLISSKKNIAIKFKGIPYYEYKMKNLIESKINSCVSGDVSGYNINIEIKETESQAAFSQNELLKEQKRIAAKVEICDLDYNILDKTILDTFSTYDVSDDYPYASISSKRSTTEFMLEDLSHNISLFIIGFIKSR